MNRALLLAVAEWIAKREKAKWSRDIGAGFIAEDIERVSYFHGSEVGLIFSGRFQAISLEQMNLRELDALQKFLCTDQN